MSSLIRKKTLLYVNFKGRFKIENVQPIIICTFRSVISPPNTVYSEKDLDRYFNSIRYSLDR